MLDPARQVPPLQPHVQRRVCCALVCEFVTSPSGSLQRAQGDQGLTVPRLVTEQCPEPQPSSSCRGHTSAGSRASPEPRQVSHTHFLSFSSSCCLSFSRSITDSCDSFRSPSSFLFALSRSMRTFFSCSRELSSWSRKGGGAGRERTFCSLTLTHVHSQSPGSQRCFPAGFQPHSLSPGLLSMRCSRPPLVSQAVCQWDYSSIGHIKKGSRNDPTLQIPLRDSLWALLEMWLKPL